MITSVGAVVGHPWSAQPAEVPAGCVVERDAGLAVGDVCFASGAATVGWSSRTASTLSTGKVSR